MRFRRSSLSFVSAALLCSSGAAIAHHSFGTFDMNRSIEIAGTIEGIDFVNPHAWLRVNVRAADGNASLYRCEMRGATVLRRSGWTPEMFVTGDAITVQAAPDRNDPLACYVNTLVLANGRSLDRYTQNSGTVNDTVATRAAADATTGAAVQGVLPRMP